MNNHLYEFSVPMPFSKEGMEQIVELNKSLIKSKITSVYNCVPDLGEEFTTFEQARLGRTANPITLDELFEIATIGKMSGIDFIYILNSPSIKTEVQASHGMDKVEHLIQKMQQYGFNKIRACNIMLIDYLTMNHPEIDIYTSTSQEYTTSIEYIQMLQSYPNIKEILPSWDINKNIRLIRNLNQSISQDIEIMVNEGCIAGCPFRTQHNCSLRVCETRFEEENNDAENQIIDQAFYSEICFALFDSVDWKEICLSNVIYPWEIEKYSKATGITHFKLVGRNSSHFENNQYISFYEKYLKIIDNPDLIDNATLSIVNHYIVHTEEYNSILLKDIKDYLPSIDYFIKNEPDCANICDEGCQYCYSKIKTLQELVPIVRQENN